MAKTRLPEDITVRIPDPPALPPVDPTIVVNVPTDPVTPTIVVDEPDERPTRTNITPPPTIQALPPAQTFNPNPPKDSDDGPAVNPRATRNAENSIFIFKAALLFISVVAVFFIAFNAMTNGETEPPVVIEPSPVVVTEKTTTHHVIKRGENMMVLANRNGVTQKEMIEANLDLIRENTASCDRRGSTTGPCKKVNFNGEMLAIGALLPGQTANIPSPNDK